VPLTISIVSVLVVNFAFADTAPNPSQLEKYLQDVQLVPHNEAVNGYQQVYYLFEGQKIFVTSDNLNHTNPISKGRYIVWIGSSNDTTSQVYLYDVLTNTTLQLSGLSTNRAPDMDGNRVVWEQWINDNWQVMYYDGLQVVQVSSGSTSFRPRILGDQIMYVTYDSTDPQNKPWHIIEYNTQTNETTVVATTANGSQAWPHFDRRGDLRNGYDLNVLSR
jgi:hypothetical protein